MEEESILNKKRTGYRKNRDKNTKKINFGGKKSVIDNALKLYDRRAIIIDAFVNNRSFHGYVERNVCYGSETSEPKFKESMGERTKLKIQIRPKYTVDEFNKLIDEKEKSIKIKSFQNHFKFPSPSLILRIIYNVEDKKEIMCY